MSKQEQINEEEPTSIKNEDWRLQAITTLTEDWTSPIGITHTKGSPVMLSGKVKISTNELSFGIPSIVALFLDYSNNMWKQAQEALQDPKTFNKLVAKHLPPNLIAPSSNDKLFLILEKRMVSIVFAYSALESFANEYIPEDYVFTKERGDKKCVETYTKEQIENTLSLEIKIGTILPSIMGVDTFKGTNLWERFLKLQNLRDRIIHMKTKDRRSVSVDDNSIWQDLLNRQHPNFAKEAKDVINYLLSDKTEKTRWFKKCPIQ